MHSFVWEVFPYTLIWRKTWWLITHREVKSRSGVREIAILSAPPERPVRVAGIHRQKTRHLATKVGDLPGKSGQCGACVISVVVAHHKDGCGLRRKAEHSAIYTTTQRSIGQIITVGHPNFPLIPFSHHILDKSHGSRLKLKSHNFHLSQSSYL